jgi:glycerol-1-phosphate dehydrogenase [NAD(P)+]
MIFDTKYILNKIVKNKTYDSSSFNLDTIKNNLIIYERQLVTSYIERRMKEELELKNTSKIKDDINWLEANLSSNANLNFISKLFNDEIDSTPKVLLNLSNSEEISLTRVLNIPTQLKAFNIGAITIAGKDPLQHPNFKEILKNFKRNKFNIKIVTSGENLLVNQEIVAKYVNHIKIKTRIDAKTNCVPSCIDILNNIILIAKNEGRQLKSQVDIKMLKYDLELLIRYLQKCIYFSISRISIDLCEIELSAFEMSKIDSLRIQYQNQIQFWVSKPKNHIKQNTFQNCYVPLLRWVISSSNDVYPCCRYGEYKSRGHNKYFVSNLEQFTQDNFDQKIKNVAKKIDPKICHFCSPPDEKLNLILNNLRINLDIDSLRYSSKSIFRFPERLTSHVSQPSIIEIELQDLYSELMMRTVINYERLAKAPNQSSKIIEDIDSDEKRLREIIAAWQKMFRSPIAKKGRELGLLLEPKSVLKKISDNVIAVKGELDTLLCKILYTSVIITEEVPFGFLKRALPGFDLEACEAIFDIGQIQTGANLKATIDDIKKKDPTYLVGIGGGRVADILKFIGWKNDILTISIPTSLATHVYASPKIHALKPIHEYGYAQTIDGEPSSLSVLDIELMTTLKKENIRLLRAGLGDIMAFVTARPDWHLSIRSKNSTQNYFVDDQIEKIIDMLGNIQIGEDFTTWYYDYLKMQSMLCNITDWCGSSPASGSEHLFAKCAEDVAQGSPFHGELVVLGVILMGHIHKLDEFKINKLVKQLQLPTSLAEIGLVKDEVLQALLESRTYGQKKNRYTIFEEINNSENYFLEIINECMEQGFITE